MNEMSVNPTSFNVSGVMLAVVAILLYIVAKVLSFVRNSKKPLRISFFSSGIIFFISLIFLKSKATYESIITTVIAFVLTFLDYRYPEICLRLRYEDIRTDLYERTVEVGYEVVKCAFLCVCIFVAGAIRYQENVIVLEPEVKTTVYYFGENAEMPTDLAFLSDSPQGDILSSPVEVILVAGLSQEYMERIDVYNYSEDWNVEPPKRNVVSTQTSCKIYINRDKYYELFPGSAAVDVLSEWE